jgi:DNA-binding transcriptional LysR family regulator
VLLRQLEYLTALAREEHFGRAAQACHISQPALSAGIRKLEAELGVQIVQRGQRFQGFTAEGTEVLAWAQRVLAEHEGLRQTIADMRGGLAGVLRIGAIPTALTVASLFTTPLHQRQPKVRFALESLSSREIVSRLNDYDLDVGMTYTDGEPLGKARVLPLYREDYLFLTPVEGQYGSRESVTWVEAAGAPLCLLTPDMQNRRIIDGYFADVGAEAEPVVETDTISAIYAHLAALRLSCVIPHAWLHSLGAPEGFRVIRLPRPRRTLHVGLVLGSRDAGSLLTRALVETATSVDVRAALAEVMARFAVPAP